MTGSPISQSRTNLIRQMAQDLKSSRSGSIPSRTSKSGSVIEDNTDSSFHPESEELGSTRDMNERSADLPELRNNAQMYNNPSPYREPDYQINTSAIGRAFPGLSSCPSSEASDESRSIEIGRAPSRGQNMDNDHSSFAVGDSILDHPIAPVSRKEANASLKRVMESTRKSLGAKETRASPPTVKATDYGSNGSRHSSGEARNTLAAGHAQIPQEENVTHISDDRPSTVNITSRSTRFATNKNIQPSTSTNIPRNFSTSKDFLRNLSGASPSNPIRMHTRTNNPTVTSTYLGSIMLPDMPNITELVSGIYEDGTPIFTRHGTSRTSSRFHPQSGRKSRFEHRPVAEIAIPEDEEAIFVSLKLLQEKLANLEGRHAEQEAHIQALQDKNRILEREKLERKRLSSRDSGIGHASGSDGDDDFARESRKSIIERTRLESAVHKLQEQLNTSNKKFSASEKMLKSVSLERDSAISQLGVAFVTMEQLKAEKEVLFIENDFLRAEVIRLGGSLPEPETTTDATSKTRPYADRAESRESAATAGQDYTQILNIDANIPRRYQATNQEPEPTTHDLETKKTFKEPSKRKKTRIVLEEYYVNDDDRRDQEAHTTTKSQVVQETTDVSRATNRTGKLRTRSASNVAGSSRFNDLRHLTTHPESTSGPRADDRDMPKEQNFTRFSMTANDTILSHVARGEVGAIRDLLNTKRNRKWHKVENSDPLEDRATVDGLHGAPAKSQLPRKSSLKNLSSRLGRKVDYDTRQNEDEATVRSSQAAKGKARENHTTQSRFSTHTNAQTDVSLLEQRNRRRGITTEDMTSAFILPDVTMHNPGEATVKLSNATQDIFDNLAHHSRDNCTVCTRIMEHGIPKSAKDSNPKVTIPKPVPVTDRELPAADDTQHTVRPSQPPALALATVLKGLEDELSHLKIQLAQLQALYNGHDPALSKRKRKTCRARIEKMLREIDIKADQIYALYDVLEGQKEAGVLMSEQEVEVTLQSLGVQIERDGDTVRIRGGDIEVGVDDERDVLGEGDTSESDDEAGEEVRRTSRRRGSIGAASAKSDKGKKGKKVRHVWDLDSDEEDELPREEETWKGFETTGELTGRVK